MSYILDALKKSEKERQRGTVPDLMTPEDVIAEETKKRSLWPYLIVGALILNAGLLAWWLAWHSKKPDVAAHSTAGRQLTANADVASPPEPAKTLNAETRPSGEKPSSQPEPSAPGPAVKQGNSTQKNQPLQAKADLQKNVESKPAPADASKESQETHRAVPQQAPAVNQPAAEPRTVTVPAPMKNKLYSLNELPPTLQQSLPALSISTHLYSADTSSRVVRINGQTLREGQFLTAGLKLEEITFEGVIFSYQNYRFRIGLK